MEKRSLKSRALAGVLSVSMVLSSLTLPLSASEMQGMEMQTAEAVAETVAAAQETDAAEAVDVAMEPTVTEAPAAGTAQPETLAGTASETTLPGPSENAAQPDDVILQPDDVILQPDEESGEDVPADPAQEEIIAGVQSMPSDIEMTGDDVQADGTQPGDVSVTEPDAENIKSSVSEEPDIITESDPTEETGAEKAVHTWKGYVWFDEDGNGQRDASEAGAAQIQVNLYDAATYVADSSSNNVKASVRTKADGSYELKDLEAGVYRMELADPQQQPGGDYRYEAAAINEQETFSKLAVSGWQGLSICRAPKKTETQAAKGYFAYIPQAEIKEDTDTELTLNIGIREVKGEADADTDETGANAAAEADTDGTGANAAAEEGTHWSFDAYYVNENDRHYVEKTDDFNLKYQLELHTSMDIGRGQIKIRVPRELFLLRDGTTSVVPSEIGVPRGTLDSPVKTSVSSFNYYIEADTVTGEETLVFFNYELIPSGSNAAIQVLYKDLDVMEIQDMTEWSIVPEAEVTIRKETPGEEDQEPVVTETKETKNAEALQGVVDTSVNLVSVAEKAFYTTPKKSYAPGLYTQEQVEAYLGGESLDEKYTQDMSKWRFVVWEVSVTGSATQPWDLLIKNTPGNGGEVAGTSCGLTPVPPEKYGEEYQDYYVAASKQSGRRLGFDGTTSENGTAKDKLYVVTAYPAAEVPEGTLVENGVSVVAVPCDGVDAPQEKSADAKWSWVDYKWVYGGDKIGPRKWAGNRNVDLEPYSLGLLEAMTGKEQTYDSWLDIYRAASSSGQDKGGLEYTSAGFCKGYALTHYTDGPHLGDYIEGTSYVLETVDDVLYAYPDIAGAEEGHRILTSADYYFDRVSVVQNDTGYDPWEDRETKPDAAGELIISAMFAGSDSWETVATVPWNNSGRMTYTFTADDLARKPWRVKAAHSTTNYWTACQINVSVTLRHDSPVFKELLETDGLQQVTVENLCGVIGSYYKDGQFQEYFHNQKAENGNYSEPGLIDFTKQLYGTLIMRDNAFAYLTSLKKHAQAAKTAAAWNDPQAGRVHLTYNVTGYDGYRVYGSEAVGYLKEAGVESPGRPEWVFYDVLPYGVRFDPSVEVKAGRITSFSGDYTRQPGAWDKSQVGVSVDTQNDIIENYKGTGRTLVKFHVTYHGADAAVYSDGMWFEGFGISFGAYYDWKDLDVTNGAMNVCAIMPSPEDNRDFLGEENEVARDNGDTGTAGDSDYDIFALPDADGSTGDLDGDGDRDEQNVLYAKGGKSVDIALSSMSQIEKLVRADSDRFGSYQGRAQVQPGSGYTYDITVKNTSGTLKDIVVFDRLEQAPYYREEIDTTGFEENWWYGAFAGIVTDGLKELGIAPVIYYNADRDAAVPEENTAASIQAVREILEAPENGWVKKENWDKELSEVRAIAVDLSEKTDGNDFEITEMGSVTFQIKMTAPAQMQNAPDLEKYDAYDPSAPADHAYNNASYYSVGRSKDGQTTSGTEAGNSTIVDLCGTETYEVAKEFAGDVPQEKRQEAFLFTVKMAGNPYVSKEYTLWRKQEEGGYVKDESRLYATDEKGQLSLYAGEKAVFTGVADAALMSAEEEQNIFWKAEHNVTDAAAEDGQKVRTETVANSYRPILYVAKKTDILPSGMDVSAETFTMRLEADGKPVKDSPYWYVKRARTDGGIPEIDTEKGNNGRGITGEDGTFVIHSDEVIALFPGNVGVNYKVKEIAGANSEEDDWICKEPEASGTLPVNGKSVTITNIYRWRSLYVTKLITHRDAEKCTEEFTFKLELKDENGAPYPESVLEGITWTLLENSQGTDPGTEPGTTPDAEEIQHLEKDGCFTAACAGKTVRIDRLPAGATFTLRETGYNEQLYLPENGGVLENTIPVYSLHRSVRITNDYLLRPLTVSKLVLYDVYDKEAAEEVKTKKFTFTVEMVNVGISTEDSAADSGNTGSGSDEDNNTEVMYRPLVNTPYRLYENGTEVLPEDGQEFRTDVDGRLYLKHGEKAVFEDVAREGTLYRVTEDRDTNIVYEQILPADGKPAEGKLGDGNNEVRFVNGNSDDVVIRKEYTAADGDMAAQRYLEELKADSEKGAVSLHMQVKDKNGKYQEWPTKTITVTLMDRETGNVWSRGWLAGRELNISPWIDVRIRSKDLPGDSQYRLTESSQDQHRLFEYSYTDDEGEDRKEWLSVNQTEPEADGTVSGTAAEQKEAVFVNHISSIPRGSEIVKQMAYGSEKVPVGSVLVWQVQRYNGAAWEAAKSIPYYVRDGAGAVDDRLLTTGKDGKIYLKKTEHGYPVVAFPGNTVQVNLQTGTKGSLRVVEVPEESDVAWGYLAGYAVDSYSGITNNFNYHVSPEEATGFVNANLGMEAEIAKVMDESCDETFTMILERVLSANTENISSAADITSSEAAKGIAYTVYDETGKKELRRNRTTAKGEIFIKAGEVARLTLPEGTCWTVHEVLSGTYDLKKLESSGNSKNLGGNLALIGMKAKPVQTYGTTELTQEDVKKGVIDALTGEQVIFSGNIAIPELIMQNGRPHWVTSIGASAFSGLNSLKQVYIPEKVTKIGERAFQDCKYLEEVNIPDGIKSIELCTFSGCSRLTRLNIPESVQEIKSNAFSNCYELKRVKIPYGVTSIQKAVFFECRGLTHVEIPKSVTYIADQAFSGCRSLEQIEIPGSVSRMGKMVFSECSSLTSVEMSRIIRPGEGIFKGCSSLTSIETILSNLGEIPESAFEGCVGLTSVTLDGYNKVDRIGYKAFKGCKNLTTVTISEYTRVIGGLAFEDCSNLVSVTIDKDYGSITGAPWGTSGAKIIWKNTENHVIDGCIYMEIVSRDNVIVVGCDSTVSSVEILGQVNGKPVTEIQDDAFADSQNLTSVEIQDGVKQIGARAFEQCKNLRQVIIPSSVTSIKSAAFWYCASLEQIEIPESVKTIENITFGGCSKLASITIHRKENAIFGSPWGAPKGKRIVTWTGTN